MPNTLPPAPLRNPVLDQNNFLTVPWNLWIQQLVTRVQVLEAAEAERKASAK